MANTVALIESYLEGPKKLRAVCVGLTPEQLKARPIPGKWSTLEVVCHLGDFEPIYVDRMKRIISHDRPLILAADESLFAAKLMYQDRDLEEELNIIELSRRHMARILRKLPDEAWQRVGVHSERGLCRLDEMLAGMVKHIEHHVPFIEEKRKALNVST